ncbi:hypothetical protein BG015_011064 [Linnemannia schmuckeri]|uniref:Uncharacterized protein n=1 Tax=Linnemannia schmuckeri TaxID=64567 RepID=A0A9P5S7E7_9FUNG|nr:hypothetical protein BG015_011064 [Linnemannia schmuckeri]
MSTHSSDVDYPYRVDSGTRDAGLDERSPSYSDIHHMANGGPGGGRRGGGVTGDEEPPTIQEPPYSSVYRAMSTQNVVVISPRSSGSPQQQHVQQAQQGQQQQRQQDSQTSSRAQSPFLHAPTVYISPSGLHATLDLESDTVEIYDRSNDGFQYSLKGSVDLEWIGNMELLLKDAQVDFMGYADTAILRHELGTGSAATETPVHHTHDFIPTPFVLAQQSSTIGSSSNADDSSSSKHQKSFAIDLTLPGHLPDTTSLGIGKIRYELQVSLEMTWAPGTSATTTEKFILRRPVLVHRIVYPSSHLQPRLAMGLDSGGVEIQVKVPRLLHCENTLLAVELYAKPRTRNVRLYKAKVVFEQIETDRYQRSSAAAVPRAIVPLATSANASATSPSLNPTAFPTAIQQQAIGPPPVPRLVTRKIAQPLEVLFEEPTTELQSQNLHLQLVLSPDLCVDVQSSWLQVSHTLRVEIEYTTDEEAYVNSPPVSAPPPASPLPLSAQETEGMEMSKVIEGANDLELQDETGDDDGGTAGTKPGGLWEQEGDAIEDDDDDDGQPNSRNDNEASGGVSGDNNDDGRPQYILDEKRAVRAVMDHDVGSGSSTVPDHHHHLLLIEDIDRPPSPPLLPLLPQSPSATVVPVAGGGGSIHPQSPGQPSSTNRHLPNNLTRPAIGRSSASVVSSSSSTYSLATEEIPVRVVRVVATALVDASTIAQAAGETEAGLPTYESVMEATGLPAYAEEKLEDDHEDAEASGTVSGVLGGAARRLEGDDAQVERRSS